MNTSTSDSPSADREKLFLQLYNAAHRRLLAFLLSLLGNRQNAEDVLQQASLLMWRKFGEFKPGSDFVAWATTIASYEARNFGRAAARTSLPFPEALLETLAAERLADLRNVDPRVDALEHCLAKLDDRNRELLCGVYREHCDVATLAEQFGRAKQTLYNRLSRLRRTLAECIEKRLAEDAA